MTFVQHSRHEVSWEQLISAMAARIWTKMPKTCDEVKEFYRLAAQSCQIDPDRVKVDCIQDGFYIEVQGGTDEEITKLEQAVDVLFAESMKS